MRFLIRSAVIIIAFMANHASNITKKLEETKFKDQQSFNVFVAKHIISPLCGGLCVLNTGHKEALSKNSDSTLKLPEYMNWKGLAMGKKCPLEEQVAK